VAFAAALAVGAVVLGARAAAPEPRASAPGVGVATSRSATSPEAQAAPAPALPAPRFEVSLPSSGAVAAAIAYPVAGAPLVEVDARPAPARAPTFVAAVRAARLPGAARPAPSGVHGGLSSPGF
jgi:translation initiation factor IF-2